MPLRATATAADYGMHGAAGAGRSFEDALISVAEQEQERIGRELHDGLGQDLAGAAFLAKALAKRLEHIDPAIAADADWIKSILARCLEDVRTLSRRLSPTELEQGNVIAAIERLCADVERAYGVHCRLESDADARWTCACSGAEAARQLFRICQEALNNATRHGACRNVVVRISLRGATLRLSVADDGQGFEGGRKPAIARSPGIGLHSMRLRARSLGGQLRLGRRCGWTHVVMRAPVAADAQSPTSPRPEGNRPHEHPRRG